MRKLLLILAVAAAGSGAVMAQQATYQDHPLIYHGDETPFMVHDTLLVPVRRTCEMIGAQFERDDKEGLHIHMQWHGNRLRYFQGDHFFFLNDRRVEMQMPSQSYRTILFVPARMIHDLTDGAFDPAVHAVSGSGPIHVYFDGRLLTYGPRLQPFWRDGMLMVPVRATIRQTSGRVDWPEGSTRFSIYFGNDRIEYEKGRNWYNFNHERRDARWLSEDRDGATYVPLNVFKDVSHGRIHG